MKNFERVDPAPRRHPSDGGMVVFMCQSGGWVMARRPRCVPYCLTLKDWAKLEKYERPAA